MFYASYIVVESIIMYTYYYVPTSVAPWTSSLDGYVRNINVAIIIIIIIENQKGTIAIQSLWQKRPCGSQQNIVDQR